ncbi:MAG: hypothetical protein M3R51_02140 [Candidatus Eremiobacteraeota bacterium]|nr:hypothetical protein [Candidatus Eremiobacteraeota bacterium]
MKCDRLLDQVSAQAVGFPYLRAALAPASEYGDRVFAELVPYLPGQEDAARVRASKIAGIARALAPAQLDTAREIFRNVPDAASAIARASMGDTLRDADFLELQRCFDACARIDVLCRDTGLPACVNDGVLACARALEIGRAGKLGFYLSDAFESELAAARSEFGRAQAEYDAVRGRSNARIAQALGREISGTEFIVMRVDVRGPLPTGVRVVREAPTYFLCEFDADEATLAALERRDACATAVAIAEEATRGNLSYAVRSNAAALDVATRALGEIDVLVTAARFAQTHDCVVPTIVERTAIAFADGRFVPLVRELEREGRAFTPITVALDDVAVLTGPNMGGKSVCLKTCGFIAMCAAFGLPVPANVATCALFDEIAWLGIGDGENGGLLSSFAQEIVRLRDVLARERTRRFVLLDEFARTTTPREGGALLAAVIGRLHAMRVTGIAATHLAGIAAGSAKHLAVRGLRGIPHPPTTTNLSDALAALAASMDYTIEEVREDTADRSDAIALASLLGLDEGLVQSAYRELRSLSGRSSSARAGE